MKGMTEVLREGDCLESICSGAASYYKDKGKYAADDPIHDLLCDTLTAFCVFMESVGGGTLKVSPLALPGFRDWLERGANPDDPQLVNRGKSVPAGPAAGEPMIRLVWSDGRVLDGATRTPDYHENG